MNAPLAALGFSCLCVLAGPLHAQGVPGPSAAAPGKPSVFGKAAAAPSAAGVDKVDGQVFPANNVPSPTMPDQIKPSTLALPNEPIEPWLLTKDAGPFMVMARTFRGPDAERCALALAKELRGEYHLPSYILRTKDFPKNSNIRDVPPTAPEYVRQPQLTEPEKVRSYDEAAVLVGNAKTEAEAKALLHQVRKIRPACLSEISSLFNWRQGLSQATRTTNPYVPTQNIFPGRKKDTLVAQMNSGPRSVYNCPGRYTLQVAEFNGRSYVYNSQDKTEKFLDSSFLKKSPLLTAADDAERLADNLAKDPEVQQMGFTPYVYHDRTSSKVMIGSFKDPSDPAAAALHDHLIQAASSYTTKKKGGVMIAPANRLTDLEDQMHPIKVK